MHIAFIQYNNGLKFRWLSQFTRLMDGRTDGQTDWRLYDRRYCVAYNAERKNVIELL